MQFKQEEQHVQGLRLKSQAHSWSTEESAWQGKGVSLGTARAVAKRGTELGQHCYLLRCLDKYWFILRAMGSHWEFINRKMTWSYLWFKNMQTWVRETVYETVTLIRQKMSSPASGLSSGAGQLWCRVPPSLPCTGCGPRDCNTLQALAALFTLDLNFLLWWSLHPAKFKVYSLPHLIAFQYIVFRLFIYF